MSQLRLADVGAPKPATAHLRASGAGRSGSPLRPPAHTAQDGSVHTPRSRPRASTTTHYRRGHNSPPIAHALEEVETPLRGARAGPPPERRHLLAIRTGSGCP